MKRCLWFLVLVSCVLLFSVSLADNTVFKTAATQALEVALTNDCALDVFDSSGNYLDPALFHNASYSGEYRVRLSTDGRWTFQSDTDASIEDIYLYNSNFNQMTKLTGNVHYTGSSFVFTGKYVKSLPKYIDTDDPSKTTGWLTIDPKQYDQPQFVVDVGLITAELPELPANRAISLSADSPVMYTGQQLKITSSVQNLLETAPQKTQLVWSTSDKNIAEVNATGSVKGKNPGKVTITASAKDDDSISASIELEIRVPVKSVAINEKKVSVVVGAQESASQAQLSVTIKPENAFFQTGRWESSNPEILTVDENGLITGVKQGNANVLFISDDPNGVKRAQLSVQVGQAVQEIDLSASDVSILVKKSATVKATVSPANATNKKLEWISENPEIAKVNNNGAITGVAFGRTKVIARVLDGSGIESSVNVLVVEPVLTVSIDKNSYDYGEAVKLSAAIQNPDGTSVGLREIFPKATIKATLVNARGSAVDGFIVQGTEDLILESDFPMADDYMPAGEYRIKVDTNVLSLKANTDTFVYTADKSHIPDPSACNISLSLSSNVLYVGDEFIMNATVTGPDGELVPGIKVGFKIITINRENTKYFTDAPWIWNVTDIDGVSGLSAPMNEKRAKRLTTGKYIVNAFILDTDISDEAMFEFLGSK